MDQGRNSQTTKNKYGIFFFVLTFIFILIGCEISWASKPLTVIDDLQRSVELPRPAVRIVSLSDAHTENLVAIRAVRQLVGVNFSADGKWVLKNIPRLSLTPSAEQIAALDPDIVIVDTGWAKKNMGLMKDLDKAGIKYAALDRPKWAVLTQYLEKLGAISGRSKEAAQTLLLSEKSLYKGEIRSAKTKNKKVFVIAGADFSTCAADSWGQAYRFDRSQDHNRRRRDQNKGLSVVYILRPAKLASEGKDAEVIITLKNIRRGVASVSREEIMKDTRFKNIPAVRNGMVWEMDEFDLMLPSIVRLDSSLLKCWQLISGSNKIK